MIAGVQILAMIFSLIMIYLTYVYFRRKNYGYRSFILWLCVWVGALVLVSFPRTIYGVMETLKIERTQDFFVLIGFAFFSVVIFYLYVMVKKNNDKLEELVRNIAFSEAHKRKKRK